MPEGVSKILGRTQSSSLRSFYIDLIEERSKAKASGLISNISVLTQVKACEQIFENCKHEELTKK